MLEREFKYLVNGLPSDWEPIEIVHVSQGYMRTIVKDYEARIAIRHDNKAKFCVKEKKKSVQGEGPLERRETEFSVDMEMAEALMHIFSPKVVAKTRYRYENGWEFDVYTDDLEGIVVAEIEIDEEDERETGAFTQQLEEQVVVISDVTGKDEFLNRSMAALPLAARRRLVKYINILIKDKTSEETEKEDDT